MFILILLSSSLSAQSFTEILGRPESSSITMSILFDQETDVYWEYGTSSGSYTSNTPTFPSSVDSALEVTFTGLQPNTVYYYRTRYRAQATPGLFLSGPEHTFRTQRTQGSTFTFAVAADPHLDTNSIPAAYALTLQNVGSKNPDFLFDLGDTFMSEKLQVKTQDEITKRHLLYRPYFGAVCHSVPLFLVMGNHEGEQGWKLDGTANCVPVMAANTRKLYYPNPFPDSFYSGNTKSENFVGLRENYYAWQWGDALFIVLDPYWYTTTKTGWGCTLGDVQYNWFKNTLASSQAKFKFVFCHNLVGGNGNDARGGAEYADLFEMGGKNTDSTWGFDANRPGWGKPIHELMKENNVTIFFHGHDHFFGKQDKDGIVYQEVPQPSNRNITNMSAAQYGYVNGSFLPGRGFLSITVSDSTVKVDYIRTYLPGEENASHMNSEVAFSYSVKHSATPVEEIPGAPEPVLLGQNYPNPFYTGTSIRYKLREEGTVQLRVYDMTGREVATLVDKSQQPGTYTVPFNPGNSLRPGGMYYCRITAGNFSKSIKMICIR